MRMAFHRSVVTKDARGVTLVEVMVAMVVLTFGALAAIRTFSGIAKSIQYSRFRTVATSLAQEKIQETRQQPYYRVIPSTAVLTLNTTNPSVTYDTVLGEEILSAAGAAYSRFTLIELVEPDVSGNLVPVALPAPDTGLKRITVSIVWQAARGERRAFQLPSVLSNPNTVMRRATIQGNIMRPGPPGFFVPLAGATVRTAENLAWQEVTDAAGNYSMLVAGGNYSLIASAPGFQSTTTLVAVEPNATLTSNFMLTPQVVGVVRGTAWVNEGLVISQVVTSTSPVVGGPVEYIELFNPTTMTWTMATGPGPYVPQFSLEYNDVPLVITVGTPTIPAGGYYLVASGATVGPVVADARYPAPVIPDGNGSSSIELFAGFPSVLHDTVGWKHSAGGAPAHFETNPLNGVPLDDGEQLVRKTSTDTVTAGVGNAYDSGDNSKDFMYLDPALHGPRNSVDSPAVPLAAGEPAVGAFVTATDGFSISTRALAVTPVGYTVPAYAEFNLIRTTTGTWTVVVSSKSAMAEIAEVLVTAASSVTIPSPITDPPWSAALGTPGVAISSNAIYGYISGRVQDSGTLLPVPAGMTVRAAGLDTSTDMNGRFTLALPASMLPNDFSVVANPNNLNSTYVSRSSSVINLDIGDISSGLDFFLPQAGRVRCTVTSDGATALGNILVSAFDTNGIEISQAVSDNLGVASFRNLGVGTYTLSPILDFNELSVPSSTTVNTNVLAETNAGVFTITGSMGTIVGSVTFGGTPVQSGTLVVASLATLGAAVIPPTSSSTTFQNTSLFFATTDDRGNYTMSVVGGNSYFVRAYYSTYSGSTPTRLTQEAGGGAQAVAQGARLTRNIAW